MVSLIAGIIWGLIAGIVFGSFERSYLFSWQYWVILIMPIIIFTLSAKWN
jgi:Na+/H+-dicarboxylate symporter